MRNPFQIRSAAVAFGAALVLLVGLSALSWRNTARLLEAARRSEHTERVIGGIRAVQTHLTDAEAAERGFVLTGDDGFLAPHRIALDQLPGHIESLRALTSDNPAQQRRLGNLEPLIRAQLDWISSVISLRREKGVEAATGVVRTSRDKQIMDRIRSLLAEMMEEERQLLAQRTFAVEVASGRANRTLLAGWLVGAALILVAFFAFDAEIRRRTRAEAERATSETRLHAILDHSPVAIYVKDLQGRFVLINQEVARILGKSREEVIGRTVHEFFPADVAETFRENDLKVLREGIPVTMEVVAPLTDGSHTYLSTRFPLRDDSGAPYALCGISTDITERKRAEEERHQTQAFLDAIVENLPHMVFVKDARELRFVRFNRAGEDLIGLSRAELIGKNDYDFFPKEQADFFTSRDRRVLESGCLLDVAEEPIETKERGTRILHTKKVPILGVEGRPSYLLGISEDITERKRAEQAIANLNESLERHAAELQSANGELEAFSYSVSHDLRAPLRHVAGFADMLHKHAASSLDDTGRRYLGVISKSAQQMGALIDDLLVFSRMGRSEMARSTVRLAPLVEGVIREMAEESAGRRIDWKVGALPVVQGDPAMLRLVIVNLIANAVKYTRDRAETVIEIESREGPGGEAVVFVKDNGVGFDMQYAHKLFGVFQRLHSAEEFEGTGIGLASVRRIVQRHGGRTWAEGEVGRGATFYFSLPMQMEGVTCPSSSESFSRKTTPTMSS